MPRVLFSSLVKTPQAFGRLTRWSLVRKELRGGGLIFLIIPYALARFMTGKKWST